MGKNSSQTEKTEMEMPLWAKAFFDKSNEMGMQGIDNANSAANAWFNPSAGSWQRNVMYQASGKYL